MIFSRSMKTNYTAQRMTHDTECFYKAS